MKVINLIIKPTSECNLRCKYCYHATTNYVCGRLNIQKIYKLLDLTSDEYDTIKITWHGGEPMLLGQKFYKDIFKYQKNLEKTKKVTFYNAMQTNGTLITASWCRFFKKYRLNPGISFDGPSNDIFRSNSKEIMDGIKQLSRHKISVGCLSVINKNNIDQVELYDAMKVYANHLKFNPVFSTDNDPDFEIDVNDFIKGSIKLFDHWLYDKKGILVEPMALYMSKALGLPYSSCANSSCLGKWLDIDSKGVIRTCGQSQDEKFVIGHIDEITNINDVFDSENFNNLLIEAINRREKCKKICPLFNDCQGNCLFKSFIEKGIDNLNGFSCISFKAIFTHIKTKTHELLKNKVDLETLNPIVKSIITDALSKNSKYVMEIING